MVNLIFLGFKQNLRSAAQDIDLQLILNDELYKTTVSRKYMHQRAWNHACWLNEDSYNTIYSNGHLVATFKNTNFESQYLFEDPEDVFDSALVIGQYQGTIRGGFSIRKLFQGKATELNIWNKILPNNFQRAML